MRPLVLFPALALTLAGLSGCAVPPGSGASVPSARATFYSILDRTQLDVGGRWTSQDDPTPRGCTYPLWTEGRLYPGSRLSAPPADPQAAIARASELWTRLGYSVKRTRIGSVLQVTATNSLDRWLTLRVGPGAMSLLGESECRPA